MVSAWDTREREAMVRILARLSDTWSTSTERNAVLGRFAEDNISGRGSDRKYTFLRTPISRSLPSTRSLAEELAVRIYASGRFLQIVGGVFGTDVPAGLKVFWPGFVLGVGVELAGIRRDLESDVSSAIERMDRMETLLSSNRGEA
jgi:hypothetical protein